MKIDLSEWKQAPAWILLLLIGSISIILGAAQSVIIAGNSIQLTKPYNLIVIGLGSILVLLGILEFRNREYNSTSPDLPIKKVTVTAIDIDESKNYLRVRVTGKVDPPVQGVRVWILREHLSVLPGRFHVGASPALTDKNGEWQQFTNLWKGGSFRIHAVVGTSDTEMLFTYYREAFEHARRTYRQTVDKRALSFPGWPYLNSLPKGCVTDYQVIVI